MKMFFLRFFALSFVILSLISCSANKKLSDNEIRARYAWEHPIVSTKWRGWDYIVEKLIKTGLSEEQLEEIFLDSRLPEFEYVPFKLKPKDLSLHYNNFTHAEKLSLASEFLQKYESSFSLAESQYQVSKYIIAAIILIETNCGQNLGKHSIFYRLARVNSVGEDKNVEYNFLKSQNSDKKISLIDFKERANYLESMFFPELLSLFTLRDKIKIDILEIKGSTAGAFGIPQFLPSTYLKYGVDGNKNGIVSLFEPEDAILSTANYLHNLNWNNKASYTHKKKVLYQYNRSNVYTETVLKVAIQLKEN